MIDVISDSVVYCSPLRHNMQCVIKYEKSTNYHLLLFQKSTGRVKYLIVGLCQEVI